MTERRKERTLFRDAERKEVKRSKVYACVCVGGGCWGWFRVERAARDIAEA